MHYSVTIIPTSNGYAIIEKNQEDGEYTKDIHCIEKREELGTKMEADAQERLFYTLQDMFGVCGGKHSEWRTWVMTLPGYSHPTFEEQLRRFVEEYGFRLIERAE